ncbi:XRE family transcriptional regulator [Photorhabdus sp. P32]|uniref:XRE family transcriptional regulator n=1 Tax=Photorhabdus TaxID=29487 RepID=UPI001CEC449A|nr:XRE family transcriptional regulator [Photorhabdus antumapuensis]
MKRIPPELFKSEMKRKGWTRRELAIRWGKSETWISKIVNNIERDQHWNDALNGLPEKEKSR